MSDRETDFKKNNRANIRENRETAFRKNQEITLSVDDLGTMGEGIGHRDGCTFFVAGALPGETVRARVMKMKKNCGYARLSEIIVPSPERTEPLCPVSRPCGGCTLQHLSYGGQLAHKEKKLRDCLERIGGIDTEQVEWLPILGMTDAAVAAEDSRAVGENRGAEDSWTDGESRGVGEPSPWHYRNKAQFPIRRDGEGRPAAGFFAGRSHRIVPVSSCAIQHPAINEALAKVLDFMEKSDIEPYDEERHTGLMRHLYIRRGYATGQMMVCLVINGRELPCADWLIESLRQMEGMTSICLNVNTERTNVILGKEMLPLWGPLYVEDNIGDVRYCISPHSFFQVNPQQTRRLYDTVCEFAALEGGETVWDLYCGIGTIALYLANRTAKQGGGRAGERVRFVGVEIVPEAVENARENAALNGIANAEFHCGAAEDVVPGIVAESGGRADVVIVDPPRKGCDAALLETIVQMAPSRIVYVSCNPATLARDVKFLTEKGYALRRARACDMFPMGGHVEGVVLLSKLNVEQHIEVELTMDEMDLTVAEKEGRS